MLIVSLVFGVIGVLVEPTYLIDWWHPLTITNTSVGIEDFLFGFVTAGISAVIYLIIFNKRINLKVKKKKETELKKIKIAIPLILLAVIFLVCVYLFKIHTFYSSLIAFAIPIIYIWYKRKDLIVDSILSGILLAIIGLVWFIVPQLITPGWVKTYWFMENLSGITILTAPIEDLIWGFFAGAFIGPLYQYWQEKKLTNYKK